MNSMRLKTDRPTTVVWMGSNILGNEKKLDENQVLKQQESKARASRSKGDEAVPAEKPATSQPRIIIIKPPKPYRNEGAISQTPSPDRRLNILNGCRRKANRSPPLALNGPLLDEFPVSYCKENISGDRTDSPEPSVKTLNYGFRQAQRSRRPLALRAAVDDEFPASVKVAGDKTMPNFSNATPDNKPVGGDTTCRLCGRIFKSVKSMHGHLRVHRSDRKGENPPAEVKSSSPPSSFSDHHHDQNTSPRHWPLTGKRSRQNGKQSTYDGVELDAVAGLLLLFANRNAEKTISHDASTVEKNENYESRSESRLEDEDGSGEEEKEINGWLQGNDQPMHDKDEDEKMKDLEVVYDSVPVKHKKQYTCSICGKSFSSHQALGGHTASHKKGRSNPEEIERLEEIEEPKPPMQPNKHVDCNGETTEATKSTHRCEVCGQVFPTGQALGGHKRKHVKEIDVGFSSQSFKKLANLKFNLNELPNADGDEVV